MIYIMVVGIYFLNFTPDFTHTTEIWLYFVDMEVTHTFKCEVQNCST